VQNRKGIKWVLYFDDFLSPDTNDGIMGSLYPEFWSIDGEYLFFTTGLGKDGGGTQCFTFYRNSGYGLFRLHLRSGSWLTFIPPTDSFPGYGIEFSPTGRHYVATQNGITIRNLVTGEITRIAEYGVQNFSWSPDGQYLAYGVARCGESYVETSSVFIWNSFSNRTNLLFTTEEMKLDPQSWKNNMIIIIEGEKIVGKNYFYVIYEYDITQERIVFTGTATPRP
jgi:WD40 repeat protein